MNNRTQNDAYLRILRARQGSLAEPTEEYLRGLLSELACWQGDIQVILDGMRPMGIRLLPAASKVDCEV